jgi:hypothetical protein
MLELGTAGLQSRSRLSNRLMQTEGCQATRHEPLPTGASGGSDRSRSPAYSSNALTDAGKLAQRAPTAAEGRCLVDEV